WRRRLDPVLLFVTGNFVVSLAAWIGSLPLIAYYFHLFSPGSLLANLIVVPLSSAALACNLGSLICGDWLPWFTGLFNHAGWFFMWWMVKVSAWSTTLPGAYFNVREPSIFDCIAYYIFAFGLITGIILKPQWRRWTIAAACGVGIFWGWRWWEHEHQVQITFLKGGESAYVDQPGSANDVLIDASTESTVNFLLKPFLGAQGVNRLPHLLLTHGDSRHVGGTMLLDEL